MAKRAVPIAEDNPFLTGTSLAPVTTLSGKLGLSPGARYEVQGDEEGQRVSEDFQPSEAFSDDDELEVDESVQEEMAKLEDAFEEIGLKFRMIDRIGEGEDSKR